MGLRLSILVQPFNINFYRKIVAELDFDLVMIDRNFFLQSCTSDIRPISKTSPILIMERHRSTPAKYSSPCLHSFSRAF